MECILVNGRGCSTWKEYQAMPARAMQTPANFLGGIWSPKKATPPASTMMSLRWPITLNVRPDVAPIIRNVDHDTSSPRICNHKLNQASTCASYHMSLLLYGEEARFRELPSQLYPACTSTF